MNIIRTILVISILVAVVYSSCTEPTTGKVVTACSYSMSTRQEFLDYSTGTAFSTTPKSTGPSSKIFIDTRVPSNLLWYTFDLGVIGGHSAFSSNMGINADFVNCPTCASCTSCNPACATPCTGTCTNSCHVYGKEKKFYAIDFQSYTDQDLSVIFCISWNSGDDITQWQILSALEVTKKYLTFIGTERVAFCRTAAVGAVNQNVSLVKDQIYAMGYEILQVGDMWGKKANNSVNLGPIPPDQFYWPMHVGETWGYLKLYPALSDVLQPYDIPLFNVLPLDLGVVAGVITTVQQTVNSHINLKSNERDTPNMVLTNPSSYPCLTSFANKPIHLVVSDYGFLIEASTDQEVLDKQQAIFASKFWVPLYHDTSSVLLSYDEMCPTDPSICLTVHKKNYGTKASNLGFLATIMGRVSIPGSRSATIGYDLTPYGFGIPFTYYFQFLNYPPNVFIRDKIEDLNTGIRNGVYSLETQITLADEIKVAIFNAQFPPDLLSNIRAKLSEVFTPKGINGVKIRSSSNAEDLPGFDGAGLYDSFSAYLTDTSSDNNNTCVYDPVKDDISPMTVQCAIKGVYGSLYNARAIQERTYARFTHNSCLMGISVVSKYGELGKVTGNGVGITRLPTVSTKTGYAWSLQKGDNDVTNPNPGTVSETSYCIFNPNNANYTWKIERYAIPTAGGASLNTFVIPVNLTSLAQDALMYAEQQYCIYGFKLNAATCQNIRYNTAKRGLDAEFKFIDNSKIHFKQIREFSGFKSKVVNLQSNVTCGWFDEAAFRGPNGEVYENVAFQKPTTQHSTSLGGNSSFAVDGIVLGLFSYTSRTNVGTLVWWEVDLQDSFSVSYIRIWGRSDCCYDQLKNFNVVLYFEDSTNTTISVSDPGKRTYLLGPLNYPKSVVRIRIIQKDLIQLAIAEVQVYAKQVVVGDPADFVLPSRQAVPVCVWGNWSDWSQCSALCNGGTQNRTRVPNDYCINYSILPSFESQICNTDICCVVSDWSAWSFCGCDGLTKRQRIIITNGVGCPPLVETENCTKPTTCPPDPVPPTPVTPTTPSPVDTPVQPVTPSPGPSSLHYTKAVSFSVNGTTVDPTVLAGQLKKILAGNSGVNPSTLDVTVKQTSGGSYDVNVYTTDSSQVYTITETAKSSQFASDVQQQTGTSIVDGSVVSSQGEPKLLIGQGNPLYLYIAIGAGALVFIGIIVAIVLSVIFCKKGTEVV